MQVRHERALFRQLLLLRANDLDQVLYNFIVILIKQYYVLVTLRALCRTAIDHNARGLLLKIF
jgi:hypothetical protein